ncbi:MAG: hypothetical protein E6K49_07945, partial [Gammaproteobacteria bacterium]
MADKYAIAQYLSQRPGRWTSPAEIKAEIRGIADRTLRRWLAELVREGVAERTGERKATRYRSRTSEKPASRPTTAATTPRIFSAANEQLLKRIDAPIYTRPPATYSEAWVDSYVPN